LHFIPGPLTHILIIFYVIYVCSTHPLSVTRALQCVPLKQIATILVMMVLHSCAAGEGTVGAGYSITIIPAPSLHRPKGPCGAAWGCGVTLLWRRLNWLPVLQAVCVCVFVCVCVCVCVSGLNLPVGNVIKAPHTAGSDGGTAAAVAAEEGININQARLKETALQSQP